jgi:phospholipase C
LIVSALAAISTRAPYHGQKREIELQSPRHGFWIVGSPRQISAAAFHETTKQGRPVHLISERPDFLRRLVSSASIVALIAGNSAAVAAPPDPGSIPTASPVKHVIIIVGENRSFDHLFATYVPKNPSERVRNLLSQDIVRADGSPGRNFAKGHQFQVVAPPNGTGNYFISASSNAKLLYNFLPAPDVAGVQNPPFAAIFTTPLPDPGLPAAFQFLYATGGTGLNYTLGPDIRITNANALPPGPFQMTGPTMPYDAYTGDTIHQYFQMYQQMDCAIDMQHVRRGNPTGCLHDLQSAITTTFSTAVGATPHDAGQTMAFFNMQKGDVPLFKALADQFTISDNYHQPVMGGTGPDSVPLGFADQVFFSDGKGGVAPILSYLKSLPYTLDPKCDAGHFYNAVNVNPAWTPQGTPGTGRVVPAQSIRSIGDVLTAGDIPWKYYGGGYNASGTGTPFDGSYCNICNPFEYQIGYPAMRADHMRDVTDLFTDIQNGTLPSVSYVKPDGTMDGHPASSKFDLFEAFAGNIIQLVQKNPKLWAETAIFVTVDEGGGYYDSGFIQPVDFFGTGPRIPMIAVSPFSTGGHVSHVYNEHSSFVKFVERNWRLHTTLTSRSRDNLPNPVQDDDNDEDRYVPRNMPAIGDLFDMFDFPHRDHDGDHDGDDMR